MCCTSATRCRRPRRTASSSRARRPTCDGLDAEPVDDSRQPIAALVDVWLPLTLALNQVNRSMGKDDLYPFVLSPDLVAKLSFVDDLIAGR